MVTRRMWLQAQRDAAAKIIARDERRHTLTLISWLEPCPRRHKRFAAAEAREAKISWLLSKPISGRVQ